MPPQPSEAPQVLLVQSGAQHSQDDPELMQV
jgi:hypothetical protein